MNAISPEPSDQTSGNVQIATIGKLVVEVNGQISTALIDGRPVHLTSNEQKMLAYLAANQGTVLSKSALHSHLYGGSSGGGGDIIDVFVRKLQAKLYAASGGELYIETVIGKGYQLRTELE